MRRGRRAAAGEHLRRRSTASSAAWSSATLRSRSRVPARLAAASTRRPTAPSPIDNQLFFVRLAQRIMHLLTMHSAAGRLYEVDVRLRPSGKGGLLVTSIDASPISAQRGLDLGAPGAAARPRRGGRAGAARAIREHPPRDPGQPRATRDAAQPRCAACASACAASSPRAAARAFRYQAGRRRRRRYRVPGAVLGAAVGQGLPAGGAVLGHHPAARVRRLGRPGAPGDVDVLHGAYRAFRARTHHLSLAGAGPIVAGAEFVPSGPP